MTQVSVSSSRSGNAAQMPNPSPGNGGGAASRETLLTYLTQAANTMWRVELGFAVFTWLTISISILMVAVLTDHWLWALNSVARFVVLFMLTGWALYWVPLRILPLLFNRIHPEHAARRIELQNPEIKESLISWLQLSTTDTPTPRGVLAVVGRYAVRNLGGQDATSIVESAGMVRVGAALFGCVLCGAIYLFVSPKSGATSIARIAMPWADIAPAARVRISSVSPGDVTVTQGGNIPVSVTVGGMHQGDPVSIRYDLSDGQSIGQKLRMNPELEGVNYKLDFGKSFGGIHQPLKYWIEAGDATAGPFDVTVQVVPIVAIDRIELEFPEYTRLKKRTVLQDGSFEAPEGTKARLFAHANQPMKKARLEFEPVIEKGMFVRAERIKDLEVRNEEIVGEWVLLFDEKKKNNTGKTVYRIKATNELGESNLDPLLHTTKTIRDLAPEVRIQGSIPAVVEVPVNQKLDIEFQGLDPDYGLTSLTVEGRKPVKKGEKLGPATFTKVSFESKEGATNPVTEIFAFSPTELGLNTGDEIQFSVTGKDNRHNPSSGSFEPNETTSAPILIKVVAPLKGDSAAAADDPKQNGSNSGKAPRSRLETNQKENTKERNNNKKPQSDDRSGEKGANDPENADPSNSESDGNNRSDRNQDASNDNSESNSKSSEESKESSGGGEGGDSGSGEGASEKQNKKGGNSSSKSKSKGSDSTKSNGDGSSTSDESTDGSEDGKSSDGNRGKSGKGSLNGKPDKDNSGKENVDPNHSGNEGESSDSDANSEDDTGNTGSNSSSKKSSSQNGTSRQPKHEGEEIEQIQKFMEEMARKNERGDSSANRPQSNQSETNNDPKQNGSKKNTDAANGGSPKNEKEASDQNGSNSSDSSSNQKPDGSKQPNRNGSSPDSKTKQENNGDVDQQNPKGNQSREGENKTESGESSSANSSKENNGKENGSKENGSKENGGKENGGKENSGKENGGKENGGKENGGKENGGKENSGKENGGKENSGKENSGKENSGKENSGKENGSKENGSKENGSKENGSKENGSKENGSKENGSKENGSKENGGKENGGKENGGKENGGKSQSETSGNSGKASAEGGKSDQQSGGKSNSESSDSANSPSDAGNQSAEEAGSDSKGDSGKKGDSAGSKSTKPNSKGSSSSKSQNGDANQNGSEPSGDQGSDSSKEGGDSDSGKDGGAEKSGKPSNSSASPTNKSEGGMNSGATGTGADSPLVNRGADKANIEYADKATDMVLKFLTEQKDRPDPELLRKLNWTEEDLRKFVDRWAEAKEAARRDPSKKKELDATLKSLGLKPRDSRLRSKEEKADQLRGMQEEGSRTRPPESLREQFEAFRKAAGKLD